MTSTFKRCAMTLCAASLLAASVSAAIIPVTINYNATGAVGNGTASFNDANQTLTAFDFTNTVTIGPDSATYNYTLADVIQAAISPGSGFNQLVFQITTIPVAGTPAAPLGP